MQSWVLLNGLFLLEANGWGSISSVWKFLSCDGQIAAIFSGRNDSCRRNLSS